MKRVSIFAFLVSVLALVLAAPAAAAPGAFDFDTGGNPVPDGATVTEDVLNTAIEAGPTTEALEFVVTAATDADEYVWYLWAPGADTNDVANAAFAISSATTTITVGGTDLADVAAAIQTVGEGTYSWTIEAIETADSENPTRIDAGLLTFDIEFWGLDTAAVGYNAPPDGANINAESVGAALGDDLVVGFETFSGITAYAAYDTAEFRIWTGTDTGIAPAYFLADADDGNAGDGVITIPQAVVDTLGQGTYTWSVYLVDTAASEPEADVQMIEGFYSFTIEVPPAEFLFPQDQDVLTQSLEAIILQGDADPDWYNIRITNDDTSAVAADFWIAATTGENLLNACAPNNVCAIYPGNTSRIDDASGRRFAAGPYLFGSAARGPIAFPALANGNYTMDVRTWDGDTSPATISNFGGAVSFEIAAPTIAVDDISIVSPAPTDADLREVVWVDDPAALFYTVSIQDANDTVVYRPSATFANGYDYSAAYCNGDLCSVDVPTLSSGTYTVNVTTWNAPSGAVNSSVDFTITREIPAAPTLMATGSTITWDDTPDATWYRVQFVSPATNLNNALWYRAEDLCDGTTCTYMPDGMLPLGTYNVWVSGWNAEDGAGEPGTTSFSIEP